MKYQEYMQQDTVLVTGLKLDASIGVFEWEKAIKQPLIFDVELYCDFAQAARSDDLVHAVDYAAVCAAIEALLSRQHYQLLEYLAEQICQQLLKTFSINALSLKILKPGAVAKTDSVGVRIIRCQEDYAAADPKRANDAAQNDRT